MHAVQSAHGIYQRLESTRNNVNGNTTIYTFENELQDMEIKPEISQYLCNASTMITTSRNQPDM